MHRSATYAYSQAMGAHSRYVNAHASSSAFSASANPNEDWTKISDLAERRRIQNRIAQRNYRKKLKRRLEDLERRAGSSSASPEQSPAQLASTAAKDVDVKQSRATPRRASKSSVSQEVRQPSPELLALDDSTLLFDCSKQQPVSLPGCLYSTYPSTTSFYQREYRQQPSFLVSQHYFAEQQPSTNYSQSYHPTLPTMLPSSYIAKPEQLFNDGELLNPFSMNYASLAGLDLPTSQTYPSSHSNVTTSDSISPSFNSAHT